MECAICWNIKPKKSTIRISDNIGELIRVHIYEGFSLAIKSYPSNVCSSCKVNLFATARGKHRSNWLEEVKKVLFSENLENVFLLNLSNSNNHLCVERLEAQKEGSLSQY